MVPGGQNVAFYKKPFVQGQLVKRRSLVQVREHEKPIDRQRPFERDPIEVGDESAARIDPAVPDGTGQKLHEQLSKALAVIRVERFRATVWKDGNRIICEDLGPVEQHRDDLLPQVVLDAAAAFVREDRVVHSHRDP